MNTNSYDLTNSIVKNSNPGNVEWMSTAMNILIFGAVIIFVTIFIINFIKAYKGEDAFFYNSKDVKKKEEKKHSIKEVIKNNNNLNICNYCGQENEEDAKFCKNCGNRLNK